MQNNLVASPFTSPRRASQDKRAFTQLMATSTTNLSHWGLWDSSSQGTESVGRSQSTTPDRPGVNRVLTFQTAGPRSTTGSVSRCGANDRIGLQLPWDSYEDE